MYLFIFITLFTNKNSLEICQISVLADISETVRGKYQNAVCINQGQIKSSFGHLTYFCFIWTGEQDHPRIKSSNMGQCTLRTEIRNPSKVWKCFTFLKFYYLHYKMDLFQ